jgi:List-Bact-rpt repeat protein
MWIHRNFLNGFADADGLTPAYPLQAGPAGGSCVHSLSSRSTVLAIAALASVLAACGGSREPASGSDARRGTVGLTYNVTVYRPADGTVTSVPPGIDCGPTTTSCTAAFPWSTTVTLTATPKPGLMFGTWAGECGDSNPCVLSTAQYGADKYAVAVFGQIGVTTHGNFLDPAVHGFEFKKWIDTKDGTPDPATTPHFNCAACHGANYQGLGLAPSCTQCHAQNGHPNWLTECNFCHGQPPPQNPATPELRKALYASPTANGTHPTVGTALTGCYGCHRDTVNPDGTLQVGGAHMNGTVDAKGHAVPYPVTQHGPAFLAEVAANGTQTSCAGCHGANYGTDPGNGKVCNSCHATAIATWAAGGAASSPTNWQQNCTFCHGLRKPNYAGVDIKSSGPPDDVAQRLDPAAGERLARTGQHQIHVFDNGKVPIGTGSGLPCTACHVQPVAIESAGHITADLAAALAFTGAGAFPGLSAADVAKLPSPLMTYDRNAGTCAGYCHGSAARGGINTTMNWADDFSTRIRDCTDCHGQPPPTGSLVKTTFTTACPTTTFPNGCNNHEYHDRIANRSPYFYDSCANCHFGSANGPYGGLHVNGKTDIVFTPPGAPGYKSFTATWEPATRSCTASCHTSSGTGVVRSW